MNDERWTRNRALLNCGMRNSECGRNIPSSLFDMFKNPKSAIRNPQSPHPSPLPTRERKNNNTPRPSGKRVRGVTLIEVILVMVIIGILAAIVVPRTNITLTSGTSVNGAANMIASDIRYTQECAMANRLSKTVTFLTATPTVYTFGPPSNLDPSGRLPQGVTISSDYTITFNSLGEPTTGGGGSVTISAGGLTRTITVLQYTGKVNIL